MAGVAQRHKVTPVVVATFGKRLDVVDGIGRGKSASLVANDAKRISRQVLGANITPAFAVPLIGFRVTLELVIVLHVFLVVGDAIAV